MLKDVAPSKFVSALSITLFLHEAMMGSGTGASAHVPALIYSPKTFGVCYCNHDIVGIRAQQDIGVDILYFNIELFRSNRESASLTKVLRHSTREQV